MLNVILYCIVTLLGILLFIIICPIRVRLSGNLTIQESYINGRLQLSFGYKNRGIGISIFPNRSITFGKYEKPLFSKTFYGKPIKSIFLKDRVFLLKKIPFTKLIKSILKTIRWEETSVSGRLGLSNPMQTGIIIGYVHAINGIAKPRKFSFSLEPAFSPKMNTDIKGNMQVRFSPIITTIHAGITYMKFHK
ncbi:MAG: DUF2953 domain-containing protein [Candidatus Marinimicrobia bacterium]|nr:DUF2953 domain-containing protein [Candidatus Neomarinimicrobiota bacterium]